MKTVHSMTAGDHAVLLLAKKQMEDIGWAMKGINKLGNVLESRIRLLPQKQQKWLQQTTYKVLHTVVKSNLLSMRKVTSGKSPINLTYKALITSSGAVGGAFGVAAFAADLTLATKLMMRSIMDIARSEGEDLQNPDTQLACLQVFALGGKSKHDDSLETGYYASRITMNTAFKGGTKALQGLLKGSTNPLLLVIAEVAARFSVQVSEKFVAQAMPVLGAVGGAAINLAFINHFQNMAHAHFAIRRLERKYGEALVREQYEAI